MLEAHARAVSLPMRLAMPCPAAGQDLADVPLQTDQGERPAVRAAQRADEQGVGEFRTVGTVVLQLGEPVHARVDPVANPRDGRRIGRRALQETAVPPEALRRAVARQPLEGGVDVHQRCLPVGGREGHRQRGRPEQGRCVVEAIERRGRRHVSPSAPYLEVESVRSRRHREDIARRRVDPVRAPDGRSPRRVSGEAARRGCGPRSGGRPSRRPHPSISRAPGPTGW